MKSLKPISYFSFEFNQLFLFLFFLIFSTSAISQPKEEKEKVVFDVASQLIRLNEIGVRIAGVSKQQDIDYEFLILPTSDLGAFASGDGTNRITVTAGLLEVSNDDELAWVLGHEITHLEKRHSEKERKKSVATTFVSNMLAGLLSAYLGEVVKIDGVKLSGKYGGSQIAGYISGYTVGLGGSIHIAKYNRSQEKEADD